MVSIHQAMNRYQREREKLLMETILRADDEFPFRLSVIEDIPIWEPSPARRHQSVADDIVADLAFQRRAGGAGGCRCFFYSDMYVRFPDGSIGRPDISIFCEEPVELDVAVNALPQAAIEIVSLGSENKDYAILKPFYLKMGISDVIIVNPYSSEIIHARRDGERLLTAPAVVECEVGCRVTVPYYDWMSAPATEEQ